MAATEKLKALLDERGVEYKTHDIIIGKAVTWAGSVCNWVALPDERGLAVGVYKDYLTPEQTIAVTLGNETCEWPTDMEGQRIQIADTIHMLRTEYDGDHEWEDVVIELVYVEHGGDKWVVRGARGEAWACECTVTGHDDELYDNSGDWSNLPTPWDRPEPDGWYKCPNPSCGCVVGYSLLADDSWTIYMDDYQIPFNHCPQCGKVVEQ